MALQNPQDHDIAFIKYIKFPEPVAGANLAYRIPNGITLELLTLTFTLTCDANVADRYIMPYITTGAFTDYRLQIPDSITAGLTRKFDIGAGYSPVPIPAPFLHLQYSWPLHWPLTNASYIHIDVTGVQVGDTLTDIIGWFKQRFVPYEH